MIALEVFHLQAIKWIYLVFEEFINLVNLVIRGLLWELLAALAGVYYLKKSQNIPKLIYVFVGYLWATFLVDLIGFYALVAYYSDYSLFGFVKDTVFQQNYWLFNSFKPFAFVVYFLMFVTRIKPVQTRKMLYYVVGVFFVTSIVYLISSKMFFTAYLPYIPIIGSFLLLVFIGLYFFQILKTDQILNFKNDLVFYIAVGALVWHLTITPLFIYNQYGIMTQSPQFVEIYTVVLTIMNIFMYGCYAFGFFRLAGRNKKWKINDIP